MVYGGLYVNPWMIAGVNNNTRTTLGAQTSCLVRRHDCACTVFGSLQAVLSFCPHRWDLEQVSCVTSTGSRNWAHYMGLSSFCMACNQKPGGLLAQSACAAGGSWRGVPLIGKLRLRDDYSHFTCIHAAAAAAAFECAGRKVVF